MSISKIVLLANETDAPVLADILRRHNSALTVTPVATLDDLRAAFTHLPTLTRLVSFCSPVIVPAELLAALSGPAYNFHPGPPERPGRYPAVFALYDRAERFGITVHEMEALVDSGPIVTAEWFEIPKDAGLLTLESLAFARLFEVFQRLAPYLVTVPRPLPRVLYRWSGRKTRKSQCDELCQITPGLDDAEIARRMSACGGFLTRA